MNTFLAVTLFVLGALAIGALVMAGFKRNMNERRKEEAKKEADRESLRAYRQKPKVSNGLTAEGRPKVPHKSNYAKGSDSTPSVPSRVRPSSSTTRSSGGSGFSRPDDGLTDMLNITLASQLINNAFASDPTPAPTPAPDPTPSYGGDFGGGGGDFSGGDTGSF